MWEAALPNNTFSFSASRSAGFAVWAHTAQQELTSAIGRPSSATVLWDLIDFYKGMSRPKVLARAATQNFPIGPAYLFIIAYSGERIMALQGISV